MQHTQDMPWADLGRQLRRLRVARGLTQAALAERAGVSRIYVQKLELEAERAPSLPTLERLARALRVRLRVAFVQRRTGERYGR
jgi:transcriptional regulator with XRE-family HTH domain